MAGLGINVISLVFLLIPGFVGLKAGLRGYVRLDDLTRIDKIIISLLAGGVSLVVLLIILNPVCWGKNAVGFITHIQTPNYSTWASNTAWCESGNVVTLQTLSETPIIILIGLIFAQSTIAGIGGLLLGSYAAQRDGSPRDPKSIEQPWEFVEDKTFLEEDEATVVTGTGDEIRGVVHRMGDPSEDYDVLLRDPHELIRESGNIVKEDRGLFSYHHYRDISQIYFHDLDEYEKYEIDIEELVGEIEREAFAKSESDKDEES